MHPIIKAEILRLDEQLANATDAHRRGIEFTLAAEQTVELLEPHGRVSIHSDVVSLAVEIKERPKLVELFRRLRSQGIRRRKGDKPYHCQHDTTIIFGFMHGEIPVYVHAEMRAPNCRRVQVGTQPVYKVICS